MLNCNFCNKECKNENSFKNHVRLCKENPDRQILPYWSEMRGGKGENQYTKAKRLGLEKPVISEHTREKLSIGTTKSNLKRFSDEENRKKQSIAMKRAVEKYPESYTSSNRGRTKQIEYNGIKFQGQWELDFYKWAEHSGLNPKRVIEGFKYEWNGIRTYFPDFYIESLDLYIEIKGYETERDRAKWNQFPKKLKVLKEKEICEIKKGCFLGL